MRSRQIIWSSIAAGQLCLVTAFGSPTVVETFGEYTNGSAINSGNLNGGTGWSGAWQCNQKGTQSVTNGVLYCNDGGDYESADWRYFASGVPIQTNTIFYVRADLGSVDPQNYFYWGCAMTDSQGNHIANIVLNNAWVTSYIANNIFTGFTTAYTADGTVVHLIGECQWYVTNGTTNLNLTVYVLPTVPPSQELASTPTWIQTGSAPAVTNIGGVTLESFAMNEGGDYASAANLYFGSTWESVTPDALVPSQPIVWQDADPETSGVSTTDGGLTVTGGQADPGGSANLVGGAYYSGPHSQYADIGMAYGQAVDVGPGTEVYRPFYTASSEVAGYTSNYCGGPITFSAAIYIPSSGAFNASDSIYLRVRFWDQSGISGTTYYQYDISSAANMQLLDQWQTVTVTGTVPKTNVLIYVEPTVVFDDASQDAPSLTPICYIQNISFNMALGSVSRPVLTAQPAGSNLFLNWTARGFKLQAANTLVAPSWTDYPLPAGTNPPVNVPIAPGNTDAFFRLVSQ